MTTTTESTESRPAEAIGRIGTHGSQLGRDAARSNVTTPRVPRGPM
jgi:hypothetical protein